MSEPDSRNEREKFLRFYKPLHARWLDRCYSEDIDPSDAAAVQLERAMRREGSLIGEDSAPRRDWKAAALRLAAAWRKKRNGEDTER